jgi:hypothetical protein
MGPSDPESGTAEHRLGAGYPTMEGLAVNRDFIWLATDNNGLGRMRYPKDLRPTLFRCRRPDRIPK